MYDYFIAGETCAYEIDRKGYRCPVIDKRDHIYYDIDDVITNALKTFQELEECRK